MEDPLPPSSMASAYSQSLNFPAQSGVHLGAFLKKPLGPITLLAGPTWGASNEISFTGDNLGAHQRMGLAVGVKLNFLGGATLLLRWPTWKMAGFILPIPIPRLVWE